MTDNVRALAEKLYYIAKHAEFSGDGITAIKSLIQEFERSVSDKWHKAGYEDGKRFAFSEAAEIAQNSIIEWQQQLIKSQLHEFIAAKLRQKAGEEK